MSDVLQPAKLPEDSNEPYVKHTTDADPIETEEWIDSLEYVINSRGRDRAKFLLSVLEARAKADGVSLPTKSNTPYINTIHVNDQPPYPGNREIERRIKSIIRWNAMAMVHRNNKKHAGLGGHISTYASSATLYEVAFNHVFRGRGESGYDGDQIYFQGHGSPGIYARSFLEGRFDEENLDNFRLEVSSAAGLSSYPHAWLMPDYWEYPTVSMGLGPIMAIYQARFNRYLADRGIKDTRNQRVWCFLGDGECDEPESLGAITLAAREQLDNLCFVINSNLQRLDGPVRGNGKHIQELEAIFTGAGWNVIKVIWGDDWDPLLERDESGLLVNRMDEVVDGQYQKYAAMEGDYTRQHFFGKHPELLELVKHISDDKLARLRRGGHDPEKVFAAYQAALECQGRPTVILAKTIKGYGLSGGAGRNIAHQKKSVEEQELLEFRTRFGIPISDEEVHKAPFYRPSEDSAEMRYLRERREALGGYVPSRPTEHPKLEVPKYADIQKVVERDNGKSISTTQGVVRLLTRLCRDKKIGKHVVPIVPDESRTFGMEGMFKEIGIYSHQGQLYEPVDSEGLTPYREAKDGQLLEEGISEAGSMCSFNAAGTAYSAHGINMIPFFIFYSMFGFQRIGDLIWAAADMRTKGFMLGATAGRTTLNGEGLQHQDGNSLLFAVPYPSVRAYDPAFHYETAHIITHGLHRLYQAGDTAIYYLMVGNEKIEMPEMPGDVTEGIIKGLYKFRSLDADNEKHRVQLFGSGAIMSQVLAAQQLLAEKYGISSDVWSATSYNELNRDGQATLRWNMLHPTEPPRISYLEQVLDGVEGPFIAASDYVKAHSDQIRQFIPGDYLVLGTDGMGRSDTRAALRRHFEVDRESIAIAALYQLSRQGKLDPQEVNTAIKDLDFDPDKLNALHA